MSEISSTETPPIVVGVDGSQASKNALQWAAHQAKLTGAELRAIQCWRVPNSFYGGGVPGTMERDLGRDFLTEVEDLVKEVLGDDGPRAVANAIEGHAAEVLVEASKTAQLLVVGSRGRGAFAGMLLGSISDYCVSHAYCPVVVIRHHEEE